MDCDKAIALELKHDDKLVPEEGVVIQVAFLYTSSYGESTSQYLFILG